MKKVKSNFNLALLLHRLPPHELAKLLQRRPDFEHQKNILKSLSRTLLHVKNIVDFNMPGKAMATLVLLGHEPDMTSLFIDALHKLSLIKNEEEEDDFDYALNRTIFSFAPLLTRTSLAILQDGLDDFITADGLYHPASFNIFEILCILAKKGIQDPRSILALERLRRSDLVLWVAYLIDLDKEHAQALLEKEIDAIDEGFTDPDNAMFVLEIVHALANFGPTRERDAVMAQRAADIERNGMAVVSPT